MHYIKMTIEKQKLHGIFSKVYVSDTDAENVTY